LTILPLPSDYYSIPTHYFESQTQEDVHNPINILKCRPLLLTFAGLSTETWCSFRGTQWPFYKSQTSLQLNALSTDYIDGNYTFKHCKTDGSYICELVW